MPYDVTHQQALVELQNDKEQDRSFTAALDHIAATPSEALPAEHQSTQRKMFQALLSTHQLLLADPSTLTPELQQMQTNLRAAAAQRARMREGPSELAAPEVLENITNEASKAHGEPAFPFKDLTETMDPKSPSGKSIALGPEAQSRMQDLRERNPQLELVVRHALRDYSDKVTTMQGYLKPTPSPSKLPDGSDDADPSTLTLTLTGAAAEKLMRITKEYARSTTDSAYSAEAREKMMAIVREELAADPAKM